MGTALLSGLLNNINNNNNNIDDDDTRRYDLTFSLSVPSRTSLDRLRRRFNSPERSNDTDQAQAQGQDGEVRRKVSSSKAVDLITADNATAAHDADIVILAFQPHQLTQVLADAALVRILRSKLTISLLAGVSCQQILEKLSLDLHVPDDDGEKADKPESDSTTTIRIARAIPSIGAQINESATLIARNTDTDSNTSADPDPDPDLELVSWLFGLVGSTHVVPERQLDALTAISATTHALAVVALDAIVDASVAAGGGVSRDMALALATQCLRGASTLLQRRRGGNNNNGDEYNNNSSNGGSSGGTGTGTGGMTIEGLKEAMSVPGGITINAVLELERGRVRAGISDAVRFAVRYAEGMGK
jgi:pyrroline-5-carboxylate reductase